MLKGMIRILIVLTILLTAAACGSSGVDTGVNSQTTGSNQSGPEVGRPGEGPYEN